jgi:hypothetical protein
MPLQMIYGSIRILLGCLIRRLRIGSDDPFEFRLVALPGAPILDPLIYSNFALLPNPAQRMGTALVLKSKAL